MSKNKSQLLARQAGGHLVFGPRSGLSESVDDLRARIEFIQAAAGRDGSDSDVISRFLTILYQFQTDPTVLDTLSKRMGLAKRDLIKELLNYKRKYSSESKLYSLFRNKKW
jgi:hypothetical protein